MRMRWIDDNGVKRCDSRTKSGNMCKRKASSNQPNKNCCYMHQNSCLVGQQVQQQYVDPSLLDDSKDDVKQDIRDSQASQGYYMDFPLIQKYKGNNNKIYKYNVRLSPYSDFVGFSSKKIGWFKRVVTCLLYDF